MMGRIREWISIRTVKAPKTIVLSGIIIANVFFISVAALIISLLAPPSMESTDYWSCVYYAVTMFLSGYMEIVVTDIGQTGALLVMFCVFTVILGMIVFTGAVIGYMTDFISGFIENADSGSRRLYISGHTVILNWNTRAAEIINELLYKNTKEKIVVLVESNKDEVLGDIDERLSDTIETENEAAGEACARMGFLEKRRYMRERRVSNKLTIIVREGDSWSAKQLNDISVKRAKSVIILSNGVSVAYGDEMREDNLSRMERGDSTTVKTLLTVTQLAMEEDAAENQQVVVEVENDWTLDLVNTIIGHKRRKIGQNIIPVAVNHILGQIFSQISVMPELNVVYGALFSNRSAAFFTQPEPDESLSEEEFVTGRLKNHLRSIPLTVMADEDGRLNSYYMSDNEKYIRGGESAERYEGLEVSINPDYKIGKKRVIILGHNSKNTAIMEGFETFSAEWKRKDGPEIMDIVVIDNGTYLEKQDYYKKYPFVGKAIPADVFEKDLICGVIDEFIGDSGGHCCIVILSDDSVSGEEIDADALTYLILVQEIIYGRIAGGGGFDPAGIEMVVEILNPKNYDIVSNYSTNNIVISNRYISKIITQIGEKEALFDFYYDILTYDEPDSDSPFSKELYIKRVSEFFLEAPAPCSAAELIRAVYRFSPDENKSVVLGYIKPDGKMVLFTGDQSKIKTALTGEDKLVLFSNH